MQLSTLMPFIEIIDYFNDRMRGEAVGWLPEEPLRIIDGRVEGRFGGNRLGSVFRSVISTDGSTNVLGYQAALHATRGDGSVLAALEIFKRVSNGPTLVFLDRLCRIVHMLNHLAIADRTEALLFLHVELRHVLSVVDDHGRYFEEVLQRCGLEPARVVFEISATGPVHRGLRHLVRAVASYRRRGYRISLGIGDIADSRIRRLQGVIDPDFLTVRAERLAAARPWTASRAGRVGPKVIATHVDRDTASRLALAGAWATQSPPIESWVRHSAGVGLPTPVAGWGSEAASRPSESSSPLTKTGSESLTRV